MRKRPIKLCFCSSSGGHYWAMLQLKQLADKYPNFSITEKQDYGKESLSDTVYSMPMLNRRALISAFLLLWVFARTFFILVRENPTHIIADGAFVTVPPMLIGRLLGKKIIFFETLARVSSPSMSGRIAYKFFTDLFIVQYSSMLKIYPKALVGSVI